MFLDPNIDKTQLQKLSTAPELPAMIKAEFSSFNFKLNFKTFANPSNVIMNEDR